MDTHDPANKVVKNKYRKDQTKSGSRGRGYADGEVINIRIS